MSEAGASSPLASRKDERAVRLSVVTAERMRKD